MGLVAGVLLVLPLHALEAARVLAGKPRRARCAAGPLHATAPRGNIRRGILRCGPGAGPRPPGRAGRPWGGGARPLLPQAGVMSSRRTRCAVQPPLCTARRAAYQQGRLRRRRRPAGRRLRGGKARLCVLVRRVRFVEANCRGDIPWSCLLVLVSSPFQPVDAHGWESGRPRSKEMSGPSVHTLHSVGVSGHAFVLNHCAETANRACSAYGTNNFASRETSFIGPNRLGA